MIIAGRDLEDGAAVCQVRPRKTTKRLTKAWDSTRTEGRYGQFRGYHLGVKGYQIGRMRHQTHSMQWKYFITASMGRSSNVKCSLGWLLVISVHNTFSSYRTENILRLHYMDLSINAVSGNNQFTVKHETHKYIVWAECWVSGC
jgi:hypothetical protein